MLNSCTTILTVVLNIGFLTVKSITTDPAVLRLMLLPVISTFVLNVRFNRISYEQYEACVEAERKKEYVKRTVYWQDYAKEIRLSEIVHVLLDDLDEAVCQIMRNIKKYGLKKAMLSALRDSFAYTLTVGCTIAYAALRLLYWKLLR